MNSINNSGFDNRLYAARQRMANSAKITKTAAEEPSFQTVLKDTLYANRISADNTVTKQAPEPNTSLRRGISSAEFNRMLRAAEGNAALTHQIMENAYLDDKARIKGTVQIPLGKNDLISLMEEVEGGIANGESFSDILQKWNERQVKEFFPDDDNIIGVGNSVADLIFIDPDTGEIKNVSDKSRHYWDSQEDINSDVDSVWDLAYDLQQFLNATVFRNKDFVSDEEANKIIAEVKARQANKNYNRFDYPFGSIGYEGWVAMNKNIPAELSDAQRRYYEKLGVLGGGALIDDFMSAIGRHSDDEYDKNMTSRAVDVHTDSVQETQTV